MVSSIRSATASLALLLAAALALPAHAETPSARQLFELAQREYAAGDYASAVEDFTAAYQARALPALLFNIAQCHRQLDQLAQAEFFYARFLELDPASPDAPTARALLQEVRTRALARRAEAERRAQMRAAAPRSDLRKLPAGAVGPKSAPPELLAPAPRPIYRRPWFWAATGAAVLAASATVILLTRHDPPASPAH